MLVIEDGTVVSTFLKTWLSFIEGGKEGVPITHHGEFLN